MLMPNEMKLKCHLLEEDVNEFGKYVDILLMK